MANTLGSPSPIPGGSTLHQRSGSTIAIAQRRGKMIHRLSERGLTAEYEIKYRIGAGNFAHSYLVEVNGYLFESPATWFRSFGWDVSPGYAAAPAIDFDRPITQTCLFCHAGDTSFSGADGRRLANPELTSITCERCHGPAGDHLRRPRARNIVNPARLSARARNSVCEQCHIEGEVRVLNPGKSWSDFHPGDELENVMAVYVPSRNGQEVKAVSQVEQLAASRCASRSGGKLWCGTCHNPHGASTDRASRMREICQSCHAKLSASVHPASARDCVSCHMPRLSSEYAHVAVTDHRIVRRAEREETSLAPATLRAWVEPAVALRGRNRVVAELTAGVRLRRNELTQAGLEHLRDLSAATYQDDAVLQAAACDALVQQAKLREGLPFCREAATLQPQSADRAMALGAALARVNDIDEAERHLIRAVQLDPSLKRAYVELWTLYERQGRTAEMRDIIARYLKWNPRNIMFRILQSDPGLPGPEAVLPLIRQ